MEVMIICAHMINNNNVESIREVTILFCIVVVLKCVCGIVINFFVFVTFKLLNYLVFVIVRSYLK